MLVSTAYDFKQNLNDGALRDTVIESTVANRSYRLAIACQGH